MKIDEVHSKLAIQKKTCQNNYDISISFNSVWKHYTRKLMVVFRKAL
jgi:hypothetical protein